VLNLLADLRKELGLTYLLITHNLAVLCSVAERIAVMYLGQLVEHGRTSDIVSSPAHPYTRALLAAASKPDPLLRRTVVPLVGGDIPSPRNPPPGCYFHPRCPIAQSICGEVTPVPRVVGSSTVRCHFPLNIRS
jgi:peptide/nickel transport system ATP-binding protein